MTLVEALLDQDRRLYFKITTPKFRSPFLIKKSEDGFVHYSVFLDGPGKIAAKLQGSFTRPDLAIQAVRTYIESAQESKVVRRDNYQDSKKEAVTE